MSRFPKAVAVSAAGLVGAIAIGVGSAGAQLPADIRPCGPGETPQFTNGMPSCMPGGTGAMPGGPGPMPGGTGAPGGGMMLPPLEACAPGQIPSPAAPCKFDGAGMPECGPEGPPQLNPDGSLPPGAVPCKPKGMGPQFDAAPPAEATKKVMTLDVEIDGSGDDPGSFDSTLVAIKKGIGKGARAQLADQLEGESFTIYTNAKTKCFADKASDPDAIADKVSCTLLSEATDDAAVSLKATVLAKMTFDQATRQPTFTAKKIVIKGKSKM